MNAFQKFLRSITDKPFSILDCAIQDYTPIDLSINNPELESIDIKNPEKCQNYVDAVLRHNEALVAYGGYLEKRSLYENTPGFSASGKSLRNIHLGIDFWAKAGTGVILPIGGMVHSFRNNGSRGDYGPTIILQHESNGFRFHTLYGHLSIASIQELFIGKVFEKGETLASLGTTDINVNYAPHLHFQLIIDLEDKKGDYPGVCSVDSLALYSNNCPDPNLLLGLP